MIFIDASGLDIVSDIMSLKFSAAKLKATYSLYIRCTLMVIKNAVVLPLLVSLFIDALVERTLKISHPIHTNLYISTEKDILLMSQAADTFVKNGHGPAPVHANTF